MQIGNFGWVGRRSAWAESESWRAKRSAMAQDFVRDSDALSATLTGVQINLSTGKATLAAQALLARVQSEAKARAAAAKSSGVNRLV